MVWIKDDSIRIGPTFEKKKFPWWIFLLATPLLFLAKKDKKLKKKR